MRTVSGFSCRRVSNENLPVAFELDRAVAGEARSRDGTGAVEQNYLRAVGQQQFFRRAFAAR